jgi:hypothetical protein
LVRININNLEEEEFIYKINKSVIEVNDDNTLLYYFANNSLFELDINQKKIIKQLDFVEKILDFRVLFKK